MMIPPPVVEDETPVQLKVGKRWLFFPVYKTHVHCFHLVDRYTDESARVYVRGCCTCGCFERCEAASSKHGNKVPIRPEDLDTYTKWKLWTIPSCSWY